MIAGKKILIMMSGSIAGFKVCALISKLIQGQADVRTVATSSALKFIGPATLEGLTGHQVYSETFDPGAAMAHIDLIRWADLILLAPATANTLNKMASGIGDDLLTTLFLAHDFKKPFLVAPAMNSAMYQHPITQDSIEKLSNLGLKILESATGMLACGETGPGRLLEPEVLLNEINRELEPTKKSQRDFKILVTFGGTTEPIDAVRVISNTSTGASGAALVDELTRLGHTVVAVMAQSASRPNSSVETHYFGTSESLDQILKNRLALGDINAVVHMAAVSDYQVDVESLGLNLTRDGKLDSSQPLSLKLVPTKKIASHIRSYSPTPLHLTTFKLTATDSFELQHSKILKLVESSKSDLVVHNDLLEMKRFEKESGPIHLYLANQNPAKKGHASTDLAMQAPGDTRLAKHDLMNQDLLNQDLANRKTLRRHELANALSEIYQGAHL